MRILGGGRRMVGVSLLVVAVVAGGGPSAQSPTAALAQEHPGSASTVSADAVREVAGELRCVVCQNLSVADSPSEMASQMRGIIRDRLAAGESPEQVVQYFVDKYGEWILLAPRGRGFNLMVWAAPVVAVLAGLIVVAVLLRRWTRRRPAPQTGGIDSALRERIRRELASEPAQPPPLEHS